MYRTACKLQFFLKLILLHATPWVWPQVIIIISFDIIVRILWLQLFVVNSHLGGPVISTHFWESVHSYSCNPHAAAQPCVGGSRYGPCSGQSADFIWQWIHSLVRYLNKNAFVKPSLQWNIEVLIFFPRVQKGKLLSGLSIYVTVAALLWPFLIHKPTQSRHFHPFPYVCNGSQEPHYTTEQAIYSKGRSQLSLRHNLEHSRTIVLPLFHPVSDGRGRQGEDFPVKDMCMSHMNSYGILWVCTSSPVLMCGEKWALLTEGSISSPAHLLTCRMFTPLTADCQGFAHVQDDFWLQVKLIEREKMCILTWTFYLTFSYHLILFPHWVDL